MQSALNHALPRHPRTVSAGAAAWREPAPEGRGVVAVPVIHSVTPTGFVVDAVGGAGIGDVILVAMLGGEVIEARISAVGEGGLQCDFLRPLEPSELHAVRAGGRVVRPGPEESAPVDSGVDEVHRWPLPARTGIAIGGAVALWVLIGLALL